MRDFKQGFRKLLVRWPEVLFSREVSMPQVTTLKGLCNEIYQTSIVGNINITAQNIKRSYKYHIRYKSRHGWTHLKTRDFKRIGIAKQLCLRIKLIMSWTIPRFVHLSFQPSVHLYMSLFLHSLVSFRALALLVTVKNGVMENGDWSTVLIYKL